jgi:hypothetical protein
MLIFLIKNMKTVTVEIPDNSVNDFINFEITQQVIDILDESDRHPLEDCFSVNDIIKELKAK